MKAMVEMPEMNREVVGRVNLPAVDAATSTTPDAGIETTDSLNVRKVGLGIAALVIMAIFLFIIVQGVFQTGV